MIIGYARTSTAEQVNGLEAQRRDLKDNGAEKIYEEQVSAKTKNRPELNAALAHLRSGDVLVVTKPDRLARSTSDLLAITDDITKAGCSLIILSMGGQKIDTSNPTSKMMLTMLAAIAEFEREIMKERQREGIEAARKQNKYAGRQPKLCAQDEEIIMEKIEKGIPITKIAKDHKLSRTTIHKIKNAHKK